MLASRETPTTDRALSTPEDQDLLRAQAESGLSVAVFARERGLSNWKLYKARCTALPRETAACAPVTIVPSTPPSPAEV